MGHLIDTIRVYPLRSLLIGLLAASLALAAVLLLLGPDKAKPEPFVQTSKDGYSLTAVSIPHHCAVMPVRSCPFQIKGTKPAGGKSLEFRLGGSLVATRVPPTRLKSKGRSWSASGRFECRSQLPTPPLPVGVTVGAGRKKVALVSAQKVTCRASRGG